MHIALRHSDAAMSRNPHDREGIHAGLSEPSQHCMAERMNYKVPAKPYYGAGLLVKVIDRGHEVAPVVPVSEHQLTRGQLLAITEHLSGLVGQRKGSPCVLALAVPNSDITEARTSQGIKHHVRP